MEWKRYERVHSGGVGAAAKEVNVEDEGNGVLVKDDRCFQWCR